jgi:hypothetical protein
VELFPAEAKSVGTSVAFTFNWICAFLITRFEPDMVSARLLQLNQSQGAIPNFNPRGELYTQV